jgi:hypothetical protein
MALSVYDVVKHEGSPAMAVLGIPLPNSEIREAPKEKCSLVTLQPTYMASVKNKPQYHLERLRYLQLSSYIGSSL